MTPLPHIPAQIYSDSSQGESHCSTVTQSQLASLGNYDTNTPLFTMPRGSVFIITTAIFVAFPQKQARTSTLTTMRACCKMLGNP